MKSSRRTPTRPSRARRLFARRLTRGATAATLLVSLTGIAGGCATVARTNGAVIAIPEDELGRRVARLRERVQRRPNDAQARRDLGHLLWLHGGDSEAAMPHLRMAAEEGDLVSQASLVMIGRAHLDHTLARRNSLRIVEAALREDGWAGTPRAVGEAITAFALRDLLSRIGIRPSLDATLLPRLDARRMSKRAPSLGVIASIGAARIMINAKADPSEAFDARGCVRDWQVSALEGRLGAADLRSLSPDDPFQSVDAARVLAAHRCSVRVWNAAVTGGVRRLRTTIESAAADLYVEVVADDEFRFYVDGQLVARNDTTTRWPQNDMHRWLRVPAGAHTLDLHLAVPGVTSTAMLNVFDGDGMPVNVASSARAAASTPVRAEAFVVERGEEPRLGRPFDADLYSPWLAMLRLMRELGEGDYDRAERSAHELRNASFAEAFLQQARFEQNEPSRGGSASSTRLQGHLQAALDIDPQLASARVQLMRMTLDRDEIQELLAMVDALPAEVRRLYEVEVLLTGLYFQRDSDVQAAQALARAKKLAPDSCWVRRGEITLARRRSQSHREDALIEAYAPCDRDDARRAEWARSRGDYAMALAITERGLQARPDSPDLLSRKARDLVALGEIEAALAVRELQLEFNPLDLGVATSYLDLAFELGRTQAATRVVRNLLHQIPSRPGVLTLAERAGLGVDPLLSRRADGEESVRAYLPIAARYEGASDVLVLDRDVVWIHDDLSQRHLIHQIVSLHSKESLDKFGEMDVPEGAELLTLRTIKPDGRVVEPEVISGKSGVSLRDLEIGDFVELEYIISRAPSSLLPGHIDLGGFRFQSTSTPFHRSELVVNMPASLPYRVDARNDPPAADETALGDRKELLFLAQEMMRRTPEPDARSLSDEMPTVRVFTDLDLLQWRRITEANLRLTLRRNEELRRLVRSLVADTTDKEAITRVIWAWVSENIERGGSMTGTITQTLAERSGNLMMLMMGMLDEAGVRTELWLAKSQFATPTQAGEYPPVEDYAVPLLVVWMQDDAPPVALVPGSKVMPFAYHSMTLAARAIRLRPGAPLAADDLYGDVPAVPAPLADRRAYDLDLRVSLAGEGHLTGSIELGGAEAIQWRQALTMFDRDRLLEVFQQAELQRVMPGTTLSLESVEIEGEEDNDSPLVFHFVADARGVGRQRSGALDLRAAVVPMNPALQYARLPERWSELAVQYAPQISARVRIEVEGGTVVSVPAEQALDGEFGRYSRAVTDGGEGRNFVTQEWGTNLKLRAVPAHEYPAFLEFARTVDDLERQELQFTINGRE